MPSIALREITDENRDAVAAIHAGPAEGRFVSSVADSIEEAAETSEGNPWYRAVYLDGEPVGFVMLSWDVTPDPPDIIGPWFLWKLLVDERHHGRGIGRAIVDEVVRLIRAEGATELLTSHVIGEGGPGGFYDRLGLVPTGALDSEGERILRLDLASVGCQESGRRCGPRLGLGWCRCRPGSRGTAGTGQGATPRIAVLKIREAAPAPIGRFDRDAARSAAATRRGSPDPGHPDIQGPC
jgi:diamine N-acetyltransferase